MIEVSDLTKRYEAKGMAAHAVSGISFTVPEGKLFTLLGPSGCGKTTTLRCIAGLERPDDGTIRLDDKDVFSRQHRVFQPPNKRPIGMVFQSYAIWPHMSVYQNVAFPLTVARPRPKRAEIRRRAGEALEMVGLLEFAQRPATALSGGQQQRVALARALVKRPKVLLLDEPLSNLDAHLRERMREEIRAVQLRLGLTAVYVTHDQGEALAISDLVMIMDRGYIVEIGTPQEIYRRPRAEFTARFIGEANVVPGRVTHVYPDDGRVAIATELGSLIVPGHAVSVGDQVTLFLRPESLGLRRRRHSDEAWEAAIQFSIYAGDAWDYHVAVGSRVLRARVYNEKVGLTHGDTVYLHPDVEAITIFREGIPVQVEAGADGRAGGQLPGPIAAAAAPAS